MAATFTCPKCGKTGSLKKEIPPGAKIRCSRCQTSFSPDSGKNPDEEVTDSVIGQFLGPPVGNPLPDSLVQEDEPMGAKARPQRPPPTALPIQPWKLPATSTEPPPLSSAILRKHGFSKAGLWSAYAVGGLLFLTIVGLAGITISGRMKSTDPVTSYRDFLRGELQRIRQIPNLTLDDNSKIDVQKTDSLVSPLVGTCTVSYVFVTNGETNSGPFSYMIGGSLEMTHGFQDGKWTMTTGVMTIKLHEVLKAPPESTTFSLTVRDLIARRNGVLTRFTSVEEMRKTLEQEQ